RAADFRLDSGRHLRGDGGDSGASVFHWVPVSSGIQIEAAGAASAVQGVCGRFVRTRAEKERAERCRRGGAVPAAGKSGTEIVTAETRRCAENSRSFASLRMTIVLKVFSKSRR